MISSWFRKNYTLAEEKNMTPKNESLSEMKNLTPEELEIDSKSERDESNVMKIIRQIENQKRDAEIKNVSVKKSRVDKIRREIESQTFMRMLEKYFPAKREDVNIYER